PVRSYLLKRFASLRMVVFDELVFPDALEDVVLLMAEGTGGCSHFEVHQVKNAESLLRPLREHWTRVNPGVEKWTHALVEHDAWVEYQSIICSSHIEQLQQWGRAYLGAVTGNNGFFTL